MLIEVVVRLISGDYGDVRVHPDRTAAAMAADFSAVCIYLRLHNQIIK